MGQCPKCKGTKLEKVWVNYWYCQECAHMFELVFGKGGTSHLATPESVSTVKKTVDNVKPWPGKLEQTTKTEFPLL